MPEEDDEANNSKIEDPSKMTADEKNEVEEKVGEAIEENFVSLEKKDERAEEKKEEPKEGEASGSKLQSPALQRSQSPPASGGWSQCTPCDWQWSCHMAP